jgi:serine/threonine-protein kinase OSR1/STK39
MNLVVQPSTESTSPVQQFPQMQHSRSENFNGDNLEISVSVPSNLGNGGYHKFSSGSLIPEHVLSPYKNVGSDSQR